MARPKSESKKPKQDPQVSISPEALTQLKIASAITERKMNEIATEAILKLAAELTKPPVK